MSQRKSTSGLGAGYEGPEWGGRHVQGTEQRVYRENENQCGQNVPGKGKDSHDEIENVGQNH